MDMIVLFDDLWLSDGRICTRFGDRIVWKAASGGFSLVEFFGGCVLVLASWFFTVDGLGVPVCGRWIGGFECRRVDRCCL
uniref:Transmembrane protein n=1 Tax=Cucumis sativus TaxID=3659 RepID=A0A0A0LKH2_CUCSA